MSRARCSPGASARFEITSASVASRRRVAIASPIDCRLEPRPEIRTPRRRLDVGHLSNAGTDVSESDDTGLASARQRVDDAFCIRCRANDHQTDAHVERTKHLVARDLSALLEQPE